MLQKLQHRRLLGFLTQEVRQNHVGREKQQANRRRWKRRGQSKLHLRPKLLRREDHLSS